MEALWNDLWKNKHVSSMEQYVNIDNEHIFVDIFKHFNVANVCDAACGFGKYSVICGKNDFNISAFDISENSIELTKNMLDKFNIKYNSLKVCNITNIVYSDKSFDGIIAHSIIDKLSYKDACKAIKEIFRITKIGGIIYVSFDGVPKEYLKFIDKILEDGFFTCGNKNLNDMKFRYYSDEEIRELFKTQKILHFITKPCGIRNIFIQRIH